MTVPGNDDAAEVLRQLGTIQDDVEPELMLVTGSSSAVREILATRPTQQLVRVLREIVLDYAAYWGERETIEYVPGASPADGQVMWAKVEDVPLLASAGDDIDAADLPLFELNGEGLRGLRLSMIRAVTETGHARFYRSVGSRQLVTRSGKVSIFQRNDRLDVVDSDTLLIDRYVDAVVLGGFAFFEERRRFERVFGFLHELQAEAGQTFDDVISGLNIANVDEMRAAVTGQQLQMLGKMASIAQKLRDYPAYRNAITMEKLAAFVAANPHTGVKIEGQGANAKFVFESDPQHRFKILKLLDDDYLQSQLTELNYDANSKGMPLT